MSKDSVKLAKELNDATTDANKLGHVITWWLTCNEVPLTDVIQALKDNDLPWEKIPKLKMDTAFRRAIAWQKKRDKTKLAPVKVKCRSDESKTQWQVNEQVEDKDTGRVDLPLVDSFSVNKDTGSVTSEVKAGTDDVLTSETKKQFGTRNQSDITKIVQALMQGNGDLYPINPVKPVAAYFVPIDVADFQRKVHAFIKQIGGDMNPFPVPKGTKEGDEAVRSSVGNGLKMMIAELEAAAEKWTPNTRPTTMAKQIEEFNLIAHKGDCFKDMLKGALGDLTKAVDESRRKLREKRDGIVKAQEETKAAKQAEKAGITNPVENAAAIVNAPAMGVKCPSCGAEPGKPCVTKTGKTCRKPHAKRLKATTTASKPDVVADGEKIAAASSEPVVRPPVSEQQPLPFETPSETVERNESEAEKPVATEEPQQADKPTPAPKLTKKQRKKRAKRERLALEAAAKAEEENKEITKALTEDRSAVIPTPAERADKVQEADDKAAALKAHVAKRKAERAAKRAAEEKAKKSDDSKSGTIPAISSLDDPTEEDLNTAYRIGLKAALVEPPNEENNFPCPPLSTEWQKGWERGWDIREGVDNEDNQGDDTTEFPFGANVADADEEESPLVALFD